MFKGLNRDRNKIEVTDFLDLKSYSRGKDRTSLSGLQKMDLFNDSFLKPFSRNRCEFSFERDFLPSSCKQEFGCDSNKPVITSFELEKSIIRIEVNQKKARGRKKTKLNEPKVNDFQENMLQKRNLNLLAFTEDLIKIEGGLNHKKLGSKVAQPIHRPEFILNKDINDDFNSDSEAQTRNPYTLSKALLDTDYLSSLKLTFEGCLNEVIEVHQDEFFRIVGYTDNARIENLKKNRRSYVCKYCGSIFHSGCALGGHISKIHRGINVEYSRRMAQRKDTQIERDRIKYIKSIIHPK